MQYTNDQLIDQLINFYKKFNRPPACSDASTSNDNLAHYSVFSKRFGSWSKALLVANLIPIKTLPSSSVTGKCSVCKMQIKITSFMKRRTKTKRFFCSHACSASYNNKGKTKSQETKLRISTALKLIKRKTNPPKVKWTDNIVGSFTRVYLNKCKKTGHIFYWRSKKPISPYIQNDYREYIRQCQFKFSISKFSDWFLNASNIIKNMVGMLRQIVTNQT